MSFAIEIISIEILGPAFGAVLLVAIAIFARKSRRSDSKSARDYTPQVAISKEELKKSLDRRSIDISERIEKTKSNFSSTFTKLRGKSTLDPSFWDQLEEMLLLADVGISTTSTICKMARENCDIAKVETVDAAIEEVKKAVNSLFVENRSPIIKKGERNVWLFVGVNGVGKTTSIAKIAKNFHNKSTSVLLVAADTFRAAAADQLEKWAQRIGVEIVRSSDEADPASVVFNGMEKANAKSFDLVLVDTAGRLHTKSNLMEEIKKIKRVIERTQGSLKEILIVLDASTGQNGLTQAREFSQTLGLTGVILTKLDGSSKGGIVLAIENELQIPVKWVGLGEGADDLIEFEPEQYIDALFE